jgi:hypothetical protein
MIAGIPKSSHREIFVLNLRFLKAHDVGFVFGDPLKDKGKPAPNVTL